MSSALRWRNGVRARWYFATIVILTLQSLTIAGTAYAQAAPCNVSVTFLPDFTQPSVVEFDATVRTEDCVRDLSSRGLDPMREWQSPGDKTWSVHGQVRGGLLAGNTDGTWTLRLGMLRLVENDRFVIRLPFTHIDYASIRPAPSNLKDLTTPRALNLDGRPAVPQVVFTGNTSEEIQIPFKPVRKHISLALEPLLGGALDEQTDAFRVSGNVTFDLAGDPAELIRHCQENGPIRNDNYRVAELLFALDMPPRFNATLLPTVYGNEPRYLSVASTLSNCNIDENGGHVEATFNGRAFHFQGDPDQFPESWAGADTPECKRRLLPTNTQPTSPDEPCPPGMRENQAYEIDIGQIVLGPGDQLDVVVPGAELRGINPPPHVGNFYGSNSAPLTYIGPERFTLHIVYAPAAGIVLQQLPPITRAILAPIDDRIARWARPDGDVFTDVPACASGWSLDRMLPLSLLLVIVALSALSQASQRYAALRLIGAAVWLIATVALVFTLRGVFGLLAAAVLLVVMSGGKMSARSLLGGVVGVALVIGGAVVDCAGAPAFGTLGRLQVDNTPITPLVLLGIGLGVWILLWWGSSREAAGGPAVVLALVLILSAITSFDALHSGPNPHSVALTPHGSVLGVVVLGLGMWFVARRLPRTASASMTPWEIVARLRRASAQPIMALGILLLSAVAFQNGLASSPATFSTAPGQWTAVIAVILLYTSIAVTFAALAVLTVVLYPLLPFRVGYLKGVALGAFFFVLFTFGAGADERLISTLPTLLIGRLVYYMGVPVLIGSYLDIHNFFAKSSPITVSDRPQQTESQSVGSYLSLLRGQINTIGAIASIVAPGIYISLTKAPLMASYYTLLEELLKATG